MNARLIIICTVFTVLTACKAAKYQFINADMSLISLGMSKEEVVERIGKPNTVVASQRLAAGDLEVFEYLRREFTAYSDRAQERPIWVYFVDNEVVEWGPGENWQMDNAIVQRMLEKYRSNMKKPE